VSKTVAATDRLSQILEAKRREVEERRAKADLAGLELIARAHFRRPLASAVVRSGRAIIAEMKQRSPSKGVLVKNYDPEALARAYHQAGAAAISVLTDAQFFGGALEHIALVRKAAPLPVLRKDFLIDEFQLLESAAAGADAVLLIVAAFPHKENDARLRGMVERTHRLGMDALVEVHNDEELDRAIAVRAKLVGVNNRDLRTFEADIETSVRLAGKMKKVISVSESGLRSPEDLARLERLGYRAFLIGEQLVTAEDPGQALRDLLAGGRRE
jgi:indole-3-glycerol phosphate synthase